MFGTKYEPCDYCRSHPGEEYCKSHSRMENYVKITGHNGNNGNGALIFHIRDCWQRGLVEQMRGGKIIVPPTSHLFGKKGKYLTVKIEIISRKKLLNCF